MALQSGDRVDVATCRGAAIGERLANLRGESAAWAAWRLLEGLDSEGDTDLNAALSAWAGHLRGAGMSVVISDLFSPSGYQQGIDALLARRQDVLLIQVLAPDELQPSAEMLGEWRLTDAEPAAPLEATITPGVLRAYRRLLQTFLAETSDFCRRRGITYVQVSSDTNVANLVLRTFRALGVLV